jgi:hypothetical protein
VKSSFGMDASGAAAFNGYVNGIATEVQTSGYIGSVVVYAYSKLAYFFGQAADAAARLSPGAFKHMYEWGNSYGDVSSVGLEQARLWKLASSGSGRNRVATFQYLPSVRPVPINPILLVPGEKSGKTVREGVHVFTWKARIMEEGTPVTIRPVQAKYLAFVGSSGDITFRKGPMTVTPRSSVGVFSRFFLVWWNSEAQDIFETNIRPELESDLFSRRKVGQIATRYKAKSKPLTISAGIREFNQASTWAVEDLTKNTRKYRSGTRRWDKYA